MSGLHTLQNEQWQIGVLPETGAALAFGRIRHAGVWCDLFRPTLEADYQKVSNCASFPLVPYSNRIRDRRFRFHGQDYELRPSKPDGTVQHGVGRDLPWQVAEEDGVHLVLTLRSADFENTNFPFRFSARLEYRIAQGVFTIRTTLKNEDESAMPGGFGHHPYFQRALTGEQDTIALTIPCKAYFPLENGMATGAAEPIVPRLDFSVPRMLGTEPIDDVLTGRDPGAPIRFQYAESGRMIAYTADPIFACMILFAPPGKPFFAVEPVTNTNDGFNLYAAGVAGTGVFELAAGEEKSGLVSFAL